MPKTLAPGFRTLIGGSLLLVLCASGRSASRPDEIPFEKHTIDLGASETAVFADINRDGKPDLVSGEYWYEAPHWTRHHFRELLYTNYYVDDLSTLPLDVDGDGYVDLVTSGWFSNGMSWWKNPGPAGGVWKAHTIVTGSPIEFSFLVDLDNDGKANEILPQFGDKRPVAWYERDGHGSITEHIVSDHSYGHGIGVGDVNGDGRNDILTPQGWLEAPADPRQKNWKFHSDWNFEDALGFIYVRDVNGDGRPDIISSMAHGYGIFWLEHTSDGQWVKHVIDDSWSQGHAVVLVDFRKSGNLGLLTGKRYMAHNGHDPGAREPLGVYWYERLLDGAHNVEWVKHVIDYGGRTGGGIEIGVTDFDGDGDLDFAVGGKSGLFLFENKTPAR